MEYFKNATGNLIIGIWPNGDIVEFTKLAVKPEEGEKDMDVEVLKPKKTKPKKEKTARVPGLSDDDRKDIVRRKKEGESATELAEEYDVTSATIYNVITAANKTKLKPKAEEKVEKDVYDNVKGRQAMEDTAREAAERYDLPLEVVNDIYSATSYFGYKNN